MADMINGVQVPFVPIIQRDTTIGNKKPAETADKFLAKELRTRNFHPRWISEMMVEGYSGAVEMSARIDNFPRPKIDPYPVTCCIIIPRLFVELFLVVPCLREYREMTAPPHQDA